MIKNGKCQISTFVFVRVFSAVEMGFVFCPIACWFALLIVPTALDIAPSSLNQLGY